MPGLSFLTMMLLLPAVASAEVMDKEPTIRAVWSTALLLGAAGLLTWSRRHPILGTIAGIFAGLFVWGRHAELTDPFVGPDIVREAGKAYVTQTQSAIILCTLLNFLGLAIYIARYIHGQRSSAAWRGPSST